MKTIENLTVLRFLIKKIFTALVNFWCINNFYFITEKSGHGLFIVLSDNIVNN